MNRPVRTRMPGGVGGGAGNGSAYPIILYALVLVILRSGSLKLAVRI